jgi:hypothetical protein
VLTLFTCTHPPVSLQDPSIRPFLDWSQQRRMLAAVKIHGLAAEVPGMNVQAFVTTVLEHAHAGLVRRGMGEEVFLRPLFKRAKEGMNPGQLAAATLRDHGMRALIDSLAIRV